MKFSFCFLLMSFSSLTLSQDNSGGSDNSSPSNNSVAGSFVWKSPDPFTTISPFQVGSPINLVWDYSSEVTIKPSKISLQLQKQDQTFDTIAVNISGTKYTWTPQGYATYKGYILYIYDADIGLNNNPPPGRARTTPTKIPLDNPNSSVGTKYGSAVKFSPKEALFISLTALILSLF